MIHSMGGHHEADKLNNRWSWITNWKVWWGDCQRELTEKSQANRSKTRHVIVIPLFHCHNWILSEAETKPRQSSRAQDNLINHFVEWNIRVDYEWSVFENSSNSHCRHRETEYWMLVTFHSVWIPFIIQNAQNHVSDQNRIDCYLFVLSFPRKFQV